MRIRDMYQAGSCGVSIEIFPPKSADGDESLGRALERWPLTIPYLSPAPTAGGTTRTRTIDWCPTSKSDSA